MYHIAIPFRRPTIGEYDEANGIVDIGFLLSQSDLSEDEIELVTPFEQWSDRTLRHIGEEIV